MVVSVLLAYASLFIWSFLPATLLPLGSELALIALVLVATVGNFLGSCTIYRLARRAARVLVSPQATELGRTRAAHLVRRWGHPALLLSWVPLLGDGLVAFAGACPCPSVPSPSGCSLQGPVTPVRVRFKVLRGWYVHALRSLCRHGSPIASRRLRKTLNRTPPVQPGCPRW